MSYPNSPPHTFCHHCGQRYAHDEWPRRCARESCMSETYRNATTVTVVIQPVWVLTAKGRELRVVGIRRGIEPNKGALALPGGFQEVEAWRVAAARELKEELDIVVLPEELRHHMTETNPRGTINLLFCIAPDLEEPNLPEFVANDEVTERFLFDGTETLVYPLHTIAMQTFFAGRRVAVARSSVCDND